MLSERDDEEGNPQIDNRLRTTAVQLLFNSELKKIIIVADVPLVVFALRVSELMYFPWQQAPQVSPLQSLKECIVVRRPPRPAPRK